MDEQICWIVPLVWAIAFTPDGSIATKHCSHARVSVFKERRLVSTDNRKGKMDWLRPDATSSQAACERCMKLEHDHLWNRVPGRVENGAVGVGRTLTNVGNRRECPDAPANLGHPMQGCGSPHLVRNLCDKAKGHRTNWRKATGGGGLVEATP
ncbi:(Myosin heavy-chain) kinase [Anopheles sinensis]|uniref:(Myosin heavy-chain) kinase n=1 Tax=Anopheles sinensis TaxID=74873 RepID=A0A084WE72_ANOSI|nr:(Myosin heavy-chain) kinase [Anopheles sinensis]